MIAQEGFLSTSRDYFKDNDYITKPPEEDGKTGGLVLYIKLYCPPEAGRLYIV
jgi:hypothetical protein